MDGKGQVRGQSVGQREVSAEHRNLIFVHSVVGIVQHPDGTIGGHRDRRQRGRSRPVVDKNPRTGHQHIAQAVEQAADRDAVRAGTRVDRAIYDEHLTVIGIGGQVIDAAQQRVDGPELGRRLMAGRGINHQSGRAPVKAPGVAAIGGTIDHVVDLLGIGAAVIAALMQAVNEAAPDRAIGEDCLRGDGQPMAGIDAAIPAHSGLFVDREIRRIPTRRDRYPHRHRELAVGVGGEITVSDKHVVLHDDR